MNVIQRVILTSIVIAGMVLLSPEHASACSCFPTSFEAQAQSSAEVFRARVRGSGITLFGETWYRMRVQRPYVGCTKRGQWILVRTPASSAACGVTLQAKTTYVVFAEVGAPLFGTPTFTIGACAAPTPWGQVSADNRATLLGLFGCCGETCSCADGTSPVSCFANPCDTIPCASAASCTPNYCGGCKAEFSSAQGEVVCAPCSSDEDCAAGQVCSGAGRCELGCQSDADCFSHEWCRPVEDANAPWQCTPYRQLGESCGGYTPFWASTKCSPGLTCLTDPMIPDLPGTCAQACVENADCDATMYCNDDLVCAMDGTCQAPDDCELEGNDWPAPYCFGYATCSPEGQCGWQCGSAPMCKDLQGQSFGLCFAILGWGVVNGTCAQVSGCSSGDTQLFETLDACTAACGIAGPDF